MGLRHRIRNRPRSVITSLVVSAPTANYLPAVAGRIIRLLACGSSSYERRGRLAEDRLALAFARCSRGNDSVSAMDAFAGLAVNDSGRGGRVRGNTRRFAGHAWFTAAMRAFEACGEQCRMITLA